MSSSHCRRQTKSSRSASRITWCILVGTAPARARPGRRASTTYPETSTRRFLTAATRTTRTASASRPTRASSPPARSPRRAPSREVSSPPCDSPETKNVTIRACPKWSWFHVKKIDHVFDAMLLFCSVISRARRKSHFAFPATWFGVPEPDPVQQLPSRSRPTQNQVRVRSSCSHGNKFTNHLVTDSCALTPLAGIAGRRRGRRDASTWRRAWSRSASR